MYIEFIGLPGAGKSTVLKYISEQSWFRDAGFSVYDSKDRGSVIYKILLSCFLLVSRFSLFVALLKHCSISNNLGIIQVKQCFAFLRLNHSMKKTKNVIFQDQGLLQMLVSLQVPVCTEKEYTPLKKINRLIEQKVKVVVFISIDEGSASERIKKRKEGYSRADRLTGKDEKIFLNDFKVVLDKIMDIYSMNQNIHILLLDGNKSLDEKNLYIKSAFKGIL